MLYPKCTKLVIRWNILLVLTVKVLNMYCKNLFKSLSLIYFTTITKQVIQLILIMLVGTDVCVQIVFVWKETAVPGRNPPARLDDHMTKNVLFVHTEHPNICEVFKNYC